MKTYSEKLKDPRWQKMRLQILNRDEFTCVDCGSEDKTLHVHHALYEKGNPWDTEARFLITVCPLCHKRREAAEARAKKEMARLFINLPVDAIERVNAWGLVEAQIRQLTASGIGLMAASSEKSVSDFWSRLATAKKNEAKADK